MKVLNTTTLTLISTSLHLIIEEAVMIVIIWYM